MLTFDQKGLKKKNYFWNNLPQCHARLSFSFSSLPNQHRSMYSSLRPSFHSGYTWSTRETTTHTNNSHTHRSNHIVHMSRLVSQFSAAVGQQSQPWVAWWPVDCMDLSSSFFFKCCSFNFLKKSLEWKYQLYFRLIRNDTCSFLKTEILLLNYRVSTHHKYYLN